MCFGVLLLSGRGFWPSDFWILWRDGRLSTSFNGLYFVRLAMESGDWMVGNCDWGVVGFRNVWWRVGILSYCIMCKFKLYLVVFAIPCAGMACRSYLGCVCTRDYEVTGIGMNCLFYFLW